MHKDFNKSLYYFNKETNEIVTITEYISNAGAIVFNGNKYIMVPYEVLTDFNKFVPINEMYKLAQEDYQKIPELKSFLDKVERKPKKILLHYLTDDFYATKKQYLIENGYVPKNVSMTTHYFHLKSEDDI